MWKLVLVLLLIFLIFPTSSLALDRCVEYKTDIRIQTTKWFGFDFPYWYGIGVMKQESACRADIVSFDGGIGLFQFTPSTGIVKAMKDEFMEGFNPANPDHSIKAFAYFLRTLYDGMSKEKVTFRGNTIHPETFLEKCGVLLSTIIQQYNGGWWFIWEWEKSGQNCDRDVIRTFCTRGGVQLKNRYLSFCQVNYDYPHQVYNYGRNYNDGKEDSPRFNFW